MQPGGLNNMIGQLTGDIMQDYQTARQGGLNANQAVQDSTKAYADSQMQGYDPDVYDQQAWSSAGIGAATPTISALESLNRAVAGYSGVRLQQRADLGKRMQAQKQIELEQARNEQARMSAMKENAGKEILDLYKNSADNTAKMMQITASDAVNVPGVGLVSKSRAQQGLDPVLVRSPKAVEIYNDIVKDVTNMMEQDKNLHFNSREEWIAARDAEVDRRWRAIIPFASGGFMPNQMPFAPVTYQPQPSATPPAKTVDAQGWTPDGQPLGLDGRPDADFSKIPTEILPPDEGGSQPLTESDLVIPPDLKPMTEHGVTTDPLAPHPGPVSSVPDNFGGWKGYIDVTAPKPQAGGVMFDKTKQATDIARGEQEQKNAENNYQEISNEAQASAAWYTTLDELDNMDLSATGSFANVKNFSGKLLESMGYANADLAKDAKNLSVINSLITTGIQTRLATQNGVQAKDDAAREAQVFAKITDPKNVFKGLIAQAKAKSLRVLEKERFYRAWKEKNGSYSGATTQWLKYVKDTPLFTVYGGKPLYQNQYEQAFIKANKKEFERLGMDENAQRQAATEDWRAIAKRRGK